MTLSFCLQIEGLNGVRLPSCVCSAAPRVRSTVELDELLTQSSDQCSKGGGTAPVRSAHAGWA